MANSPLTAGQLRFGRELKRQLPQLNSNFIVAWMLAEQNGAAAQGYDNKKYYNFLNIARTDSNLNAKGSHGSYFDSPEKAAQATAQWIQGKGPIASSYGKPASGIMKVLGVGTSPEAQIAQLARSGWASSGYNHGNTLRSLARQFRGALGKTTGTPLSPQPQTRLGATPSSPLTPMPKSSPLFDVLQGLQKYSTPTDEIKPPDLATTVAAIKRIQGVGSGSATPSPVATPATASPSVDPSGAHLPGLKGLGSGLFELFYDPQGGWKHGKNIGAIGGHSDHVHVAAGPKTAVALGKLAQSMGLHVGENPAFGGVHPVHVQGSYHYKNEADDVSGPANLMAEYTRRLRRMYHLS